jgi:dTDP-glucose 4,6-dehydratase
MTVTGKYYPILNKNMQTKKRLLVTGCNGFIGQNFLRNLDFNKFKVVNIDCLSYASDKKAHLNFKNVKFSKINLTNFSRLKDIFDVFKPDIVINFAAHSHVDKSISNSALFLENIIGTHNLLKCSLDMFAKKDIKYLQISTDEVFGSIVKGAFSKLSPYNPSSPYSASKASSDHLVSAFHKTYNLPTMITYSCNNYGPFQSPEKLIPLTILNLLKKKKVGIYGKGSQLRQWIHVKDNVQAIIKLINKNFNGNAYCIGSEYELSNLKLVKKIIKIFNEIKKIKKYHLNDYFEFIEERKGHDFRYFLDYKDLQKETNWKQDINLDLGLRATILWYLNNANWINNQFKNIKN